jgi:hypothetical protein
MAIWSLRAVSTAATFDDPELVGLVGKTMNW